MFTCRSSSPFQVGNQPSGDVFSATPGKSALKLGKDLSSSVMDPFVENVAKTPRDATEEGRTEDRRVIRSATTPNAMALAPPGERGFRTPSSRHEIGGIDAQGIYPPSACVFIAK
jgi:hypothetical protein